MISRKKDCLINGFGKLINYLREKVSNFECVIMLKIKNLK